MYHFPYSFCIVLDLELLLKLVCLFFFADLHVWMKAFVSKKKRNIRIYYLGISHFHLLHDNIIVLKIVKLRMKLVKQYGMYSLFAIMMTCKVATPEKFLKPKTCEMALQSSSQVYLWGDWYSSTNMVVIL